MCSLMMAQGILGGKGGGPKEGRNKKATRRFMAEETRGNESMGRASEAAAQNESPRYSRRRSARSGKGEHPNSGEKRGRALPSQDRNKMRKGTKAAKRTLSGNLCRARS